MARIYTTNPICADNFSNAQMEFGKAADVQKIFGIKRGTLYNLLADGKIKSVLLRVRGQKSGLRLIHMDSVREYIKAEMASQSEFTVSLNEADESSSSETSHP